MSWTAREFDLNGLSIHVIDPGPRGRVGHNPSGFTPSDAATARCRGFFLSRSVFIGRRAQLVGIAQPYTSWSRIIEIERKVV